jgi:hypothetical protein
MHVLMRGAGGEHEVIAFGVLVVVIMLFLPEGLTVGVYDQIRQWQQRRRREQPAQQGSHGE